MDLCSCPWEGEDGLCSYVSSGGDTRLCNPLYKKKIIAEVIEKEVKKKGRSKL